MCLLHPRVSKNDLLLCNVFIFGLHVEGFVLIARGFPPHLHCVPGECWSDPFKLVVQNYILQRFWLTCMVCDLNQFL